MMNKLRMQALTANWGWTAGRIRMGLEKLRLFSHTALQPRARLGSSHKASVLV
jgi:hypothetical protein